MKEAEVLEIQDEEPAPKRYKGKIFKKSYKGFGFITSEEIPFEKIFFHWTALANCKFTNIKEKQVVTFNAFEVPDKGWQAINIRMEE
jgi:cold shock CspA family protein